MFFNARKEVTFGCFFFPQVSVDGPRHLDSDFRTGRLPSPSLDTAQNGGPEPAAGDKVSASDSDPAEAQREQYWRHGAGRGGEWPKRSDGGVPETYLGSAWWEACPPRPPPVTGTPASAARPPEAVLAKLMGPPDLVARCLGSLTAQPGGRLF